MTEDVPRIVATPPGPKTREILARQERVLYPGLAHDLGPFVINRKAGWEVEDVSNTRVVSGAANDLFRSLPSETEYDLFFSYRSDAALSAEANDGTVAVSSELSKPMQRQAVHVMGFDETHTSILESAEVAEEVNAALLRVTR